VAEVVMFGRLVDRLLAAQGVWARPLGDFNHRWAHALFHRITPLRDLLNGRWLGHPLHPAATDIPIGALLVVVVLDLVGQGGAADVALVLTIVFMLAAAVTGLADYADTDGTARERATVHATLMVVALVLLVVSAVLRAGAPADRTLPIALSIVGFLIVTASAYIGGDIVYVFGNMVSRHAFRGAGTKWIRLEVDGGLTPDTLPEGQPAKAKLGINTLVLVRAGGVVHALHETCAHAGGPLSGGRVVDGCIECPWHQSRFRLVDGVAVQGPTVYDQPAYEIRQTDTGWEARRVARAAAG
jgi:nitrite reductase/ring-hydroxylating ferredoxin subunit/uncharacterized membrane protein